MASRDFIVDGITVLPNGMNSGVAPQLLDPSQTALSTNCTHRGGYIRNRPGFNKITLTFEGEDTQERFETGLWQGAAFFKSEYGTESLICSIGGRLFEVRPTIGEASATVYERTILNGSTYDTNSSGNPIAWLWQAERWMIINDGQSLPIFFDGQTARRSRGATTDIGTTAADFVVPAVGSAVNVTLDAAYTGPVNETIYIGDDFFQVNSSASGYRATLENLSEGAGTTFAGGSQLVIANNFLGQVTEARSAEIVGGQNTIIVQLDSAPNPTVVIGNVLTVRTNGNNYVSAPVTVKHSNTRYRIGPVPAGTSVAVGAAVFRGYFETSSIAGTLSSQVVMGAVGTSTEVTITTPYTGTLPQIVILLGGVFRITAVNNDETQTTIINVTNITGTPGATVSFPEDLFTVPELPVGRMGAYGMARNWMCLPDGRSYIGSDIVGGSSGSPALKSRDAVLKVTENTFLAGGGVFVVPGNIGDITAMVFTANLDTSLGQGPLQIGTPRIIFSCNAPVDRTEWQQLENPIQTESLKGKGPLGQYGTILVNSDTLFRAHDGLGSLVLARREFSQSASWGNTPISREMQIVIDEDSVALLNHATAVQFDNRLLLGCFPVSGSQGVYHQGLIALNFDPVSSLRGKAQAIYDGLWTGLQVFQMVSGEFSGDERAFAFCFQSVDNKIELFELAQSGEMEFDNESIPITWSFESASLFTNAKGKSTFDSIELVDGEIYLSDIEGVVNVQSWYRPEYSSCWVAWHEFTICGTPNIPKQYRSRLGLGEPRVTDCDPTNNRPFRVGTNFQVRFRITGACRFRGARFMAKPFTESQFTVPKCATLCSVLDESGCEECAEQGDCLSFDLVFYNLNANPVFTNLEGAYQVTTSDGQTIYVTVPGGTITLNQPFPPGGTDYPPLVLECPGGGDIVRTVPDGATQSQIDEIIEGMIDECARSRAVLLAPEGQVNEFRNVAVYYSKNCADGEDLEYTGTLPSWITLDAANERLIGAANVFTGRTQAEADASAQQAINAFGDAAVLAGTLVCVSVQCVAQTNLITVGGGTLTARIPIPTKEVGQNRLLVLQSGNTLTFLDTVTDTTVATVSLNVGVGAEGFLPGCWVSSANRFWVLSDSSAPVRSELKIFDGDGGSASSIAVGQTMENLSYSSDADLVFAGSDDGGGILRLRAFNSAGVIALNILTGESSTGRLFAEAPGYVLVRGSVSTIILFFNHSGIFLGQMTLSQNIVFGAYASNTGKLYVGTNSGTPKVLEINLSTRVVDFEYVITNAVTNVVYEPNTGAIYSLGSGGPNGRVLTVINPVTRTIVCALTSLPGTSQTGLAVDYTSGKLYRPTANTTNNLYIYEQ